MPTTVLDTPALDRCADAVATYFAELREHFQVLRGRVVDVAERNGLVTADLVGDAIEEPTKAMLSDRPLLGGGFVAAPGFLSDHHLYLVWWQGDDRQLAAQSGPWEEAPVDYTRQEWYRAAAASGEPHVAGPYVDYVCCDEYVLTATMPVVIGGTLAGVVGADTLLEVFESLMLPTLEESGCTLINHHDRVVVSADPRRPAGRLVERASYAASVPCAGTPFTIVA